MATQPEEWQEQALIGIIPEGDSEVAFAGITEDMTALDWGDKDIEGIPLINGGRLVKKIPMADESMTLKLYPVSAGVDAETTATGIAQLFHPQSTADATQPIAVDNTLTRKKFGIIILWSTALGATAGALPASGEAAMRLQIINAYMTSYKLNYDDKILSAEVTFKWTPFQQDASANKREESADGSAVQLPAAITTATSF